MGYDYQYTMVEWRNSIWNSDFKTVTIGFCKYTKNTSYKNRHIQMVNRREIDDIVEKQNITNA